MKILLPIFLFLSIGIASAQNTDSTPSDSGSESNTAIQKNLLKINLLSLPLNNYSLGYERVIGRKITAGLGVRYMAKSGIPMMDQISDLIDDPETERQLDQFEIGNTAFTPEVRFYMGKQALRGFYLAPFARFSSYDIAGPLEFDVNGTTETMPLSGKLSTVTGGLLIGAQWKLGGRVYLDWWMLGPQYGSADGSLSGKKALSAQEQQELREELENLDIPFADTKTTVDANGARLDITGPWAGVRAGLCLGIRF